MKKRDTGREKDKDIALKNAKACLFRLTAGIKAPLYPKGGEQ